MADELERQRALAPQLAFTLDVPSGLPSVSCDPDAIREALANLLDNSRRFARTAVTVRATGGVGLVEVQVTDDGPGVPAELRDRVFDRFVSSDDGSGLGLPIARAIVQAHGGDLELAGDAFVVTLPVAALDA